MSSIWASGTTATFRETMFADVEAVWVAEVRLGRRVEVCMNGREDDQNCCE